MKELNEISGEILDASFKIYTELGSGLLESVYEVVLAKSLAKRGLNVICQKPIHFEYNGIVFTNGFRVDLFVENKIIVELKSVEVLRPVHLKQVLTYIRLLKLPLGLLINFGAPTFKSAFKRVVNTHEDTKYKFQPLPKIHYQPKETKEK